MANLWQIYDKYMQGRARAQNWGPVFHIYIYIDFKFCFNILCFYFFNILIYFCKTGHSIGLERPKGRVFLSLPNSPNLD